MSSEIYAKVPLAREKREIRILTLAPGIDDDTLHGGMFTDSLDYDDLHYTALSYTWSGPVSQKIIIIYGVALNITENLELALRRIRGTRAKNLWIDAICINQNDYEEKNYQVPLMGDIYANATRTIVWLGETSGDSEMAMELIGSTHQSQISSKSLQRVSNLLQRAWWKRIWVVQEVLKSRRVTMVCGKSEVDIDLFTQFFEYHPKCSLELEQPFINILANLYSYKQQIATTGLSMADLTRLTGSLQASVPKDRI